MFNENNIVIHENRNDFSRIGINGCKKIFYFADILTILTLK